MKNSNNDESYEDVSYGVKFLFTSIFQETIDHNLQRIYVRKEIKPFCEKSIFKKVSKMEEDVAPMKPHFYKRYVDYTYIRRKKNEPDSLFEKLNSYLSNVKYTIEKNPTKFLDTEIIRHGCEMKTKACNNSKKLLVHWSSKIPTRYKRNVITGELHRAKRIANDFNFEVKRITKKFLLAGFPRNFIRNAIEYFNKDEDDFLIPEWLFDERKLILLRLSFSESNEKFTKSLIKNLVAFTNNNLNSKLFGTLKILDQSFKLKIM